jgi:hypothetical protein
VKTINGTSKERGYLKIKEGRCKPMDPNKSTTNELALEHTSMRVWSVKTCTFLVAQNGFPTLDIIIKDLSIQL